MQDGAVESEVADIQELRGSNPCTAVYFFVSNPVNAVKITNSAVETVNYTNIHH